ncbi:protein of unknown function [Burkholderia multivorans]
MKHELSFVLSLQLICGGASIRDRIRAGAVFRSIAHNRRAGQSGSTLSTGACECMQPLPERVAQGPGRGGTNNFQQGACILRKVSL